MNRRKYLASLGLIGLGIYSTSDNIIEPTLATNIDLPRTISVSRDISEKENPKLQLNFDTFKIKEQNYYGEKPDYTITAQTIYDSSEGEQVTLVEDASLTTEGYVENIMDKTYNIPLELPNEIENESTVEIDLKFDFMTNNPDIGPFTRRNTIYLTANERIELEVDYFDEGAADNYSYQDTSNCSNLFQLSSNESTKGDYSMSCGTDWGNPDAISNDQLNTYPQVGDIIKLNVLTKQSSGMRIGFSFGVTDDSTADSIQGYRLRMGNRGNEIRLSGFGESDSISHSMNTNIWYTITINWISKNYITAEITEKESGNIIANLEIEPDEDITDGRIALNTNANTLSCGSLMHWDNIRVYR